MKSTKSIFSFSNILIVEDDPDFQVVVAEYFIRRNNHRVKIDMVDSCIGALLKLEHCKEGYDMVVIDYQLKGNIDGLHLYKELTRKYPHIPSVMISAMPFRHINNLQRKEKSTPRFLSKPFSPKEFEAVLLSICTEMNESIKTAA